jgi:hypothetical protein
VLLAYVPHRHRLTRTIGNGYTKHSLGFKNTLRVMAQRSMPTVSKLFFGSIEPIVYRLIVFRLAAPYFDAC